MRPRNLGGITLAVILSLGSLACQNQSAPKAESPEPPAPVLTVAWRVDNTESIGGYGLKLLGAPRVSDEMPGRSVCFDGQSTALVLPVNPLDSQIDFTIEVAFKPNPAGPVQQKVLHIQDDRDNKVMIETRRTTKGWYLHTFMRTGRERVELEEPGALHPYGQWSFAAVSYSQRELRQYVNGRLEKASPFVLDSMVAGKMAVAARMNQQNWFSGCVSELRFANAALPAERLGRSVAAAGSGSGS